ncbi:MAG: peptidoglycan-binding domain-containing protein [Clostridia bacterium]
MHVDKRNPNPACATGGYPTVREGYKGVYVAVLQDALNNLGYNAGSIDGVFGINTKNAVMRYQKARGLNADAIVGCKTWKAITTQMSNKTKNIPFEDIE